MLVNKNESHTLLILGNQLFDPSTWPKELRNSKPTVFMREDYELCTYYQFHKHKIIFFISAMRDYRDELSDKGLEIEYETLSDKKSPKYEKAFSDFLISSKTKKVWLFEIEDKFFEARILGTLKKIGIDYEVIQSPMFLTTREDFKSYLGKVKKPFMKTFYESQRKSKNILIDKNGQPTGGQWSFDSDNRKPLPKSVKPPELPALKIKSQNIKDSIKVCDKFFLKHPGDAQGFWLPTDRKGASLWLNEFLDKKLKDFGPFEDAISLDSDFVFHSVLTPFLNTGLLTPQQIVDSTLKHADRKSIPLESLEGFLRQVMGWREFVRGIYQNFSDKQESTNFWGHKNKLSELWYTGESGIPILDNVLKKVIRYGYCHHIERLMVLGNLMLLLEIDPKESHRWFMEMFIDSSDWVMGPNVYGMALFSDGGLFSTKPYICGSNYWSKMSLQKSDLWCDQIDGLYWNFISNNKDFFSKNPRLSMMTRSLAKIPKDRLIRITAAAEELKSKLVR